MSTLLDTPIPNSKIKFFPTEPGKRFKSKVVKLLPDPLVPINIDLYLNHEVG